MVTPCNKHTLQLEKCACICQMHITCSNDILIKGAHICNILYIKYKIDTPRAALLGRREKALRVDVKKWGFCFNSATPKTVN